MTTLLLPDGREITAAEDGLFHSSASRDGAIDLRGFKVLPGLIDIHIHGAIGVDVNDADVEGLLRIARYLAENGVTAWMPTLVPDADENYGRAIKAIDELMRRQVNEPVAQALGVHYEGVFANSHRCGALRSNYFKLPAADGGDGLPRLASGIHMTTLAPEIEGGIALTERLTAEGWIVAIGHTEADVETLERAFAAGARHCTHLFNAMTGIHHRDIGVAGWAITREGVGFDVIADGLHVDPRMLKLAVDAKGSGDVILISDSVAVAGLPDGEYTMWGEPVRLSGGQVTNPRGSIAGSAIGMRDAVRMMASMGADAQELAQIASENPAKLLGQYKLRGWIGPGSRADLTAFDDDWNVAFVMVCGRIAVGSEL
jgi:N-acetylglucosamine-6-phosphate deacetylase